ncbi:hypothetical protein EDC94DRAFT_649330 [Helicostylum pulchrum]|nr:hypothetical protein EDC94DRAFT_649330 [Helicostylum pulchrum]
MREMGIDNNKFSFASARRLYWSVCAAPTKNTLIIENRVTALQLAKYNSFVLKDKYYKKEFIKHIFGHVSDGSEITIGYQEFSTRFALLMLESVGDKKNIALITKSTLFDIIVKHDKMTNITIKNQEKIANNNLDHILCSVDSPPFDCSDYRLCNIDYSGDSLINRTNLNEGQASQLIGTYAPRLVESVAIAQNYWFFMTSFSCFLHHNKVDDCADRSKIGFQDEAVAFIRRKTTLGKDYFDTKPHFGLTLQKGLSALRSEDIVFSRAIAQQKWLTTVDFSKPISDIKLQDNFFQCLRRKEWLKDNVVDFALSELRTKHEKSGQANIFNSLFFSKLRDIRDSNIENETKP